MRVDEDTRRRMAAAARDVLSEHFQVAFTAHVADHLSPGLAGAERAAAIDRLKAADTEAEERTEAVFLAAIDAALAVRTRTP
jgi:hypothetical protein